MTTVLWFEFEVQDFAAAAQALQSGSTEEDLDRSVTDALATATATALPPLRAGAASRAGANASALMWRSSPSRLWVTWFGGAIAVGVSDDALVMIMTADGCATTTCRPNTIVSALDNVDFEQIPADGQAVATVGGETLAGWVWRDGAVLRGLPGQGTRTLAEPPRDMVVKTIVSDFCDLLAGLPAP